MLKNPVESRFLAAFFIAILDAQAKLAGYGRPLFFDGRDWSIYHYSHSIIG